MDSSWPNNKAFRILKLKNNILEEGIKCFIHWLSAEEVNSKKMGSIQLTLNIFEKDKR